MNAFFFHYSLCFIPSLQYLFTASCVLNCVLGTRGHKRNGYFISQLREEKSLPLLFFFFSLSRFFRTTTKEAARATSVSFLLFCPKGWPVISPGRSGRETCGLQLKLKPGRCRSPSRRSLGSRATVRGHCSKVSSPITSGTPNPLFPAYSGRIPTGYRHTA